ncbi:MAG: hypothetical protein N4A54_06625 [Peptostreptococcaceae bacterium]|jgi:hypothetical protein|nr:hypothetical protein [Peptostreptococcaceae bacterium]
MERVGLRDNLKNFSGIIVSLFIALVCLIVFNYISDKTSLGNIVYNYSNLIYQKVILPCYFYLFEGVVNKMNTNYNLFTFIIFFGFIHYLRKVFIEKREILKTIDEKNQRKLFILKNFIFFIWTLFVIITSELVLFYSTIINYGKASTGTALKDLHGITLQNGFIALLGNGSVKTDGNGMVFGYKVLLVIFIFLLFKKYIVADIKKLMKYLFKKF